MQPGHAPDSLMDAVYGELRSIATRYIRRLPRGFTLLPTEIVHETYVHFLERPNAGWTRTGHFRAIAICKMWQVIVDHFKRRNAQKRGGRWRPGIGPANADAGASSEARDATGRPGPAEAVTVDWLDRTVELLDLSDALVDLGRTSRRLYAIVMLHWFGGMTHAEVAAELGVSRSTAEKDFRYGVAWLNRRLGGCVSDVHGFPRARSPAS